MYYHICIHTHAHAHTRTHTYINIKHCICNAILLSFTTIAIHSLTTILLLHIRTSYIQYTHMHVTCWPAAHMHHRHHLQASTHSTKHIPRSLHTVHALSRLLIRHCTRNTHTKHTQHTPNTRNTPTTHKKTKIFKHTTTNMYINPYAHLHEQDMHFKTTLQD